MSNSLTVKQKTFVAGIVSGKSGTSAAIEAYKPKNANTAGVIAYENLRKPKIIEEINNTLVDYDLIYRSVKVLAEGLEATKYNRAMNEFVPNHNVQLAASRMTINLWFIARGLSPPL